MLNTAFFSITLFTEAFSEEEEVAGSFELGSLFLIILVLAYPFFIFTREMFALLIVMLGNFISPRNNLIHSICNNSFSALNSSV